MGWLSSDLQEDFVPWEEEDCPISTSKCLAIFTCACIACGVGLVLIGIGIGLLF